MRGIKTHFKPIETFQYTHFYSSHPPGVKKGFVKSEALRLLRTNSSKTTCEENMKKSKSRLLVRGYPKNHSLSDSFNLCKDFSISSCTSEHAVTSNIKYYVISTPFIVQSVSLCTYSILSLFGLLILFVLHLTGRGITRKPQGSFIPLTRLCTRNLL